MGARDDEATSGGDSDEGAVHILFLNSDGTASSTVKISDGENGGPTGLESGDRFGSALTNLGDLNGDGIPDLAVGAFGDEATSGGDSSEGAVHILFLNSDGTASSTVKISDGENGGPTGLESSDLFGSALTNLGDLNGDGIPDLAVGAYSDEATSGGDSSEGAVHILFLNPLATQVTVPAQLTLTGDYTNSGGVDWLSSSTELILAGNTAQYATGTLSNQSALHTLTVTNPTATVTLGAPTELVNLTVGSSSSLAPPATLTLAGNYANQGTVDFAGSDTTLTLTGANSRLSGTLTGSSALADLVLRGARGVRFSGPASSTNLRVKAPAFGSDSPVASTTKISDSENGGPTGLEGSDRFGTAVTNLGDLNGDGIPDLAVGAYSDEATSGGESDEGAVHILFMNSDGTASSTVKISDNENGGPTGLEGSDRFGSALTSLGDLNGDGIPDLAVGAYTDEATSGGDSAEGAVHILFLNSDGTASSTVKISDNENSGPTGLEGSDLFGSALTNLGDLNGDGIPDLAVGAFFDEATSGGDSSEGAVHILFMNSDGTAASTVKISDGENGGPTGLDSFDRFGSALTNLGDLNGDGIPDLAVGARSDEATSGGESDEGAVHILFMQSDGTASSTVKISDNENGGPTGLESFDFFGSALTNLGDLSGDGIPDLAVGAWGDEATSGGESQEGAVHILFMNSDGTASSTVKISDNENGGPTGLESNDYFGSALTNLGDLNGDGIPDLAVGAYQDEATSGGESAEGAVHILFLNAVMPNAFLPSAFSLSGDYTNNGQLDHTASSTHLQLTGSSAQTLAGGLVGPSALSSVTFSGAGSKTFAATASTTNLTVDSSAGLVTLPAGSLSLAGAYTNNGTIDNNGGTLAVAGANATLAGTLTGGSALGDVMVRGRATFLDQASTSDLTVSAGVVIGADGTASSTIKISDNENGGPTGLESDDRFGTAVAGLGDLNGDGIPDLAVGAYSDEATSGGDSEEGAVHILFLNSDGTASSTVKISDNENGGPTGLESEVTASAPPSRTSATSTATASPTWRWGPTTTKPPAAAIARRRGAYPLSKQRRHGLEHREDQDNENGGPTGLDGNDFFGSALTNLGDLNGDGIPDLAVGALPRRTHQRRR